MIVSNSRRVVEEIYHHDRGAPFSLIITLRVGAPLRVKPLVKLTRIGEFDENSLIELWRPAVSPAPKLVIQSRVDFAVQTPGKTR